MKCIANVVVGLLIGGLLSPLSWAGVKLTYDNLDHTTGKVSESRIYYQKNTARMEGGPGSAGTVIAREDRIYVLQDDQKAYFEITAKELAQISKMMDSMGAILKNEMKKLTPEQRKQMEQMGLSSSGFEIPEIRYKKTSSAVKCGPAGVWKCDGYDVTTGGKKSAEKLFTRDIGVGQEFNPGQFQKLLEKVASSGLVQKAKEKIKGHPNTLEVASKDFVGGKLTSEHTLRSVEKQEIPASLFEVPSGYKKNEMPTLPFGSSAGQRKQ